MTKFQGYANRQDNQRCFWSGVMAAVILGLAWAYGPRALESWLDFLGIQYRPSLKRK